MIDSQTSLLQEFEEQADARAAAPPPEEVEKTDEADEASAPLLRY